MTPARMTTVPAIVAGWRRGPLAALAAGTLLVATAGCGVPPQGTTAADVARFEAAAATIDCRMVSESDYLPVELQAGLTREQSTALVSYMLSSGRAVKLPEGGVKLTTGACA